MPCLAKFDPDKCDTYGEFARCMLGVIVNVVDISSMTGSDMMTSNLSCLSKIPGVGNVFQMLQFVMPMGQAVGGQLRDRILGGSGGLLGGGVRSLLGGRGQDSTQGGGRGGPLRTLLNRSSS